MVRPNETTKATHFRQAARKSEDKNKKVRVRAEKNKNEGCKPKGTHEHQFTRKKKETNKHKFRSFLIKKIFRIWILYKRKKIINH